ncbi:GD18717 [Drosophila simulans]|nr:GD18717 [Drosophila simulans]
MPFLKRRQTIDHSRQSQPLMEEGGENAGQAKSAPGAVDRPTLMTTIAEDVAETGTAAASHAAAHSDAAAAAAGGATGAEEGHPNGMGTVIVRMERAGQQHMADEAL